MAKNKNKNKNKDKNNNKNDNKNKDKNLNKSGPGNNLGNILTVLSGIFGSIFLVLIFANVASAILDCSMCHKTVPGSAAIKAIDTIEISDKTCLKCHNPEYPPKPIGYDTHLAHIGKYSANVDYLKRHPKATESISCDNCHMNIGENCRNCHIKNIPHIEPPLGNNCKGCHGALDKLFQHSTINLKIHNIFGVNGTKACTMCHNPDNMASLKLASGDVVDMKDSYRLCFQCHSGYYNLWNSGQHHSNHTVPTEKDLLSSRNMGENRQEIRARLEDKWRQENVCVGCHNPHNPAELYQLPMVHPEKSVHTSMATIISYVIIALLMICAGVLLFIMKKKKLTFSEMKTILLGLRLSDLKGIKLPKLRFSNLKGIKLPKLKLPKISIPISLTVEKLDKEKERAENVDEVRRTERSKDVDKVRERERAEIVQPLDKPDSYGGGEKQQNKTVQHADDGSDRGEKPQSETVPNVKKKKFLSKYKYDVAFLCIICIMLGTFYVAFGSFMPMAVVASESMTPHINKGDIVFYTVIDKVEQIGTYDKKRSMSFGDYGDVIIYKPFGQEGVPYVHRAMYYVNEGDDMWPGGKKAPHAGYITKGDNIDTNRQYDQQGSVSKDTPIKRDWIVGVASFKIPYIGYIRLVLS